MTKYTNPIAQQRARVANALSMCADAREGMSHSFMRMTTHAGWRAWLAVARRANRKINASLHGA